MAPSLSDALPPRSGIRGPRRQIAWRLADALMDARLAVLGVNRTLDGADHVPPRQVLVAGVYGEEGAATMETAVGRLRDSKHRIRFALGAMGDPDPTLAAETLRGRMTGGKFANLNRLVEAAGTEGVDWLVLIDDDVALPARFLDRALLLAESFHFPLAQPALTLASHTAWGVTRRRWALARRTMGVEIGPVTLMWRAAYAELTPFPEEGMGWGIDLHWAAVARRNEWRVGILDAVPVRHEARPPATGYGHPEAVAAALEFLAGHEHLPYEEASRVLESHWRLP